MTFSYVAATVSVIDAGRRKVVKEVRLPNGSINLRDLRVSPDGKYACLAQTVGRFQVPVTQLSRGWVNTSALTLIDVAKMEVLNSVVLDDVDCGAANPWGAAWSADGRLLCVTHAGTHELSVIDFPALLKKLEPLPARPARRHSGQRRRFTLRRRRAQRPLIPLRPAPPNQAQRQRSARSGPAPAPSLGRQLLFRQPGRGGPFRASAGRPGRTAESRPRDDQPPPRRNVFQRRDALFPGVAKLCQLSRRRWAR